MTISIFITGSFLLVSEAISNRASLGRVGFVFLVLIGLGLISFSYVVEWNTLKFNDSALRRIEEIETTWNFRGPKTRQKREETELWFRLRETRWHLIFIFLICAYIFALVLFCP